jgi:hypothetical protein
VGTKNLKNEEAMSRGRGSCFTQKIYKMEFHAYGFSVCKFHSSEIKKTE